jgi:molybdopterin converting factor small subunit
MPAQVRIHLLTAQGMRQKRLEVEVERGGLRLDRLLSDLEKEGVAEKGFFRLVLKGKAGLTLLLNGERVDISDAKKTRIHDGDELVVMSPITGG